MIRFEREWSRILVFAVLMPLLLLSRCATDAFSFHPLTTTTTKQIGHSNGCFNSCGRLTTIVCCEKNRDDRHDDAILMKDDGSESINNNPNEGKIRYRARVAYDGTGYQGWQVQHNFQKTNDNDNNNNKKNYDVRTVQGEIQVVLSQRFQRNVVVVGAGRTDTGVHARGQALHFDLYPHEIDIMDSTPNDNHFCESLQKSLNSMLRRDVRIWNLGPAPTFPNLPRYYYWHVINDAKSKIYTYRFCTGRAINPNHRHLRVHFHDLTNDDHHPPVDSKANTANYGQTPLQYERMQQIFSTFVGTHEFLAFAGKVESNERKSGKKRTTIRTIHDIRLIDEGNSNYRVDIHLKGALYKMVRNIVGTAFDVYRGNLSLQNLQEMLQIQELDENKDNTNIKITRRNNKSKPVPPEGLTLEKVFFDDDTDF